MCQGARLCVSACVCVCVCGLLILSSFTFILSILCPWGASGLRLPSKLSQIEFRLAGRYRPHPDRLERERERENNHSTHHLLENLPSNFSLCLSFLPTLPAASLSSACTLFFCFSLFIPLPVCLPLSLSAEIGTHQSFLAQLGFFFSLMILCPPARLPLSFLPRSRSSISPTNSISLLSPCPSLTPVSISPLLPHPTLHGWLCPVTYSTHQCRPPGWRSLALTIIT